tara:strand:+ start:129 stop:230 length:102 start_codon:yes stop_codon:yes gene_type:complete
MRHKIIEADADFFELKVDIIFGRNLETYKWQVY